MADELDPFKAMQTEMVQYAIQKKVEERMTHYLRTRVYPIASLVVIALTFFGVTLKSLYTDYAGVSQQAADAKARTDDLREKIQKLTTATTAAEAQLRVQEGYFASTLEQQLSMSRETSSLLARSEVAVKELTDSRQEVDAQLDQAKQRVREIENSANQANQVADKAKNNATAADTDIQAARTAAAEYQKAVDTQRRLLGRRIVDFAILVRKIPSTVQLDNPNDEKNRFVLTLSPQSVSNSGFKIDFAVGGVQQEALAIRPDMFGRWYELPGTDGFYKYMIDFVYQQRGVRNFLVIRFA
ncbi:MAG TPA: hypothetical protein VF698_08845, partial [Thermoanaerobaculia bacterium]